MPTQAELIRLLVEPNESLTLEYKSWLDLSTNRAKATLAKAAIALANEGGGIIIVGMRAEEGGLLLSRPRPAEMARYSQDAVNSAINRFADPEVHCELAFATHPETQVEHAVIMVPGGMRVPMMSTRDHQGEIVAQRCYVRKPGPRSEEPFTAEEWRGMFERCLQARREDMLDAIRLIVAGHSSPAVPAEHAALDEFCQNAQEHWLNLVAPLPVEDPAQMRFGYYSMCFEMTGVEPAANFAELQRRMDEARRVKHTGWGPFVALTRDDLAPRVVDDAIQVWLGDPQPERIERTSDHCDFWRATRSGLLYLQRGYDEDGDDRTQPGTVFGVTLPVWRVAEALLFVSRLARLFGEDPIIFVRIHYTGLRDRVLTARGQNVILREGRNSADNEVIIETQASASQIEDNVVEIVHELLVPLYERFDFLELPLEFAARQIEEMRRLRF